VLTKRRNRAHHRRPAAKRERRQHGRDGADRRVHRPPPIPRRELRVRSELRRRAQLGTGDARLVQRRYQVRGRHGRRHRIDDRAEQLVMQKAGLVRGEARVRDQVRPLQDLGTEQRELTGVLDS
jgi:hypothetical protein